MESNRATEKRTLRQQGLQVRAAIAPARRATASKLACGHLQSLVTRLLQADAAVLGVALYAARRDELDVGALFAHLIACGIPCLFPRIVGPRQPLAFAPAVNLDALREGHFGIREPVGAAWPLTDIALFVVPGLAFDRGGNRLGYGRGYYDRTLCKSSAPRVGVGFAECMVDNLPHEPTDCPMQWVVSQDGIAAGRC